MRTKLFRNRRFALTLTCLFGLVLISAAVFSASMPATAAVDGAIFTEDFETDGLNTRYTASEECTDGTADFFTRTDGSNIGSFVSYIGPSNTWFWAGMDTDGTPDCNFATQMITWTNINISGYSNLVFSGLFAEDDDGTNQDWDDNDFVHVEVSVDGGAFYKILAFENDGTQYNAAPLVDTDFDGDGDGAEVTETFTEFTAALAVAGSTMDLRITTHLNSGDEDIAFDLLKIEDTPLFVEDFETDGLNTRYTASEVCNDSYGDYFTRTDGTDIGDAGSFVSYVGPNNTYFWAGMDTDGTPECNNATQMITWTNININGNAGLVFSGLFAEDDDGTNQDWDDNDFVHVEVSVDGGAFFKILAFENDGTQYNAAPLVDTDFDGNGDGAEVTETFTQFTAAITATGSTMDLRITTHLNSGDEDIAFDLLQIVDTSLFYEDFETDGLNTRYTASEVCTDNSADFFTRTDGTNIGSFVSYIGPSNTWFWAGMDTDGSPCTQATQMITWTNINISGYSNMLFSGLFAEDDDGTNQDWDDDDFVHVEVSVDGGDFYKILAFENDGTQYNAAPLVDSDFDGNGDGAEVTETFTEFTAAIADTGSTMDLRITTHLNSGDEDIAFDLLQLVYIEGPTNNYLAAAAKCSGDDLQVTISDGDGPFDITGTGPGLPLNGVAAGSHTLTGASTWTNVEVVETGGDTETIALGDITCPACGAPATLIHDIQGSGLVSPLVGSTDLVIEGVVVGDFQAADQLKGFFLQEEDTDADADAATSEGIFVYDTAFTLDVAPGDIVRVQGDVDEYFGFTELKNIDSVEVCSSGNAAAATAVQLDLPVTDLLGFEAVESMAVVISDTMTVSQNYFQGRYGQVTLSEGGRLYQPTQVEMPGTPEMTAVQEENMRRMLVLDDGSTYQNPNPIPYIGADNTLRAGDTIDNLTGVIDYGLITSGSISHYRLQPTQPVAFTRANPRTNEPDALPGSMKVAGFNVLNYFNGDGLGGGFPTSRGADTLVEFDRQRTKIITAMLAIDADVYGLMEIENDATPNSAIEDLVDGMNAIAGAGTYDFIDTGVIGTDAIKDAFIFNTTTVTPDGAYAVIDEATYPLFLTDKNRPTLAQTFVLNSNQEKLTIAVNHLKSKGSSCDSIGDPDVGDGQGNCNLTRTNAATAMAVWLATDPTGSGDDDFLIIGDLNAYAMEDPITALKTAGYTNLVEDYLGLKGGYSYTFDGNIGTLDHAMGSPTIAAQVTGVTIWHINTDEPSVIDYNEEFKPQDLYTPTAYRASDHDPIVVSLDLDSMPFHFYLPWIPGGGQ